VAASARPEAGRRRRHPAAGTAALALLLALVMPVLVGTGLAVAADYPPSEDPDAGPITPTPEPTPEPTPDPTPPRPRPPAPAPQPQPEPDPEPAPEQPEPPEPAPLPDPGPPAPPPSPVPPDLEPGGGAGEVDGEPIEVRVTPRPDPDDPVLRDLPALPPRDDGSLREPPLDATVVVEAGELGFAVSGEACAQDGFNVLGADGQLVLEAGSNLVLAGAGTAADAEVAKYLRSDPILLGTSFAGADGSFTFVGPVPEDTPMGRHTLEVGAVGRDLRTYRIALDVLVVAPCAAERPDAGNLRTSGGMALLALAALLAGLAAGGGLLAYVRHCILIGVHPDVPMPIVPGEALPDAPPLPVATRGRRRTDVLLRPGLAGVDAQDEALEEIALQLEGADLLDLDEVPVPLSSAVIVESGRVSLALAIRRPDGTHEPLEIRDGQLRAKHAGTLVLALGGASKRARVRVSLVEVPEDRDQERLDARGDRARRRDDDRPVDEQRLARLRTDGDGRLAAQLALPDDLGTRPMFVKICIRGRRGRRDDEQAERELRERQRERERRARGGLGGPGGLSGS
jgi:hypothetical protein